MNAVVFGAEVLDGCNSTSSKIHLAFSQFHSKSEAMTTGSTFAKNEENLESSYLDKLNFYAT